MSSKFVGVFPLEIWNNLLKVLETQQGEPRTFDKAFYNNIDGRFNENIKLLKDAGYDKINTTEWINYYPKIHFDENYVRQFEEFVNMKCVRAWVSKIKPGKCAPYHSDIDDEEEEHIKLGKLIRFTSHMNQPCYGQIFILENQIFHNQTQGNTYQWTDYKAFHAGGNCSLKPKFLFNFLGYI